ncbi:putative ATP-grasp target RiPP [Streptomyces sp. DI166]|uniref:putative ATP-grasp-modified RiPP n=1 Tax=Streptomyces sp. DI166 TaxID=1839783 RepID=UPI0007F51B5B|nr:putative ATP-grasp-modified RiPP [Streptomyces sp. DI166]SBT90470.1 putative ATP-grasp target RiPP [Streptomyces sp. DI166]
MFAHSDRLPTGTPLPSDAVTPPPWGVRRMAPYPTMAPGYARAEIEPTTQTTHYFDADGRVLEMGKHGTSTGTNPATNTGNPSDGAGPGGGGGGGDQDTGNDTDQ